MIVADASPLIALAQIGQLDLLRPLSSPAAYAWDRGRLARPRRRSVECLGSSMNG